MALPGLLNGLAANQPTVYGYAALGRAQWNDDGMVEALFLCRVGPSPSPFPLGAARWWALFLFPHIPRSFLVVRIRSVGRILCRTAEGQQKLYQ